MGVAKQKFFDDMEAKSNEILAKYLDISVSELSELDYNMEDETSKDGIVYATYIIFSKDSPVEILDKIGGIDDNNRLFIDTNIFDEPDDFNEPTNFNEIDRDVIF